MMILAKTAVYADDGYCTTLGFADEPTNSEHFVVLSMTNSPDEQDLALGQGGVHLIVGGLSLEGYDLVSDLQIDDSRVVLDLKPTLADQRLVIEIGNSVMDHSTLGKAVAVFKQRLVDQ